MLLSDVHANLAALEAVLQAASALGWDQAVSLGDALGYGPNPGEVLDLLQEVGVRCIAGNHDRWLLDLHPGTDGFLGGSVGAALRWQRARLNAAQLERVRGWPEWIEAEVGGRAELALCRHGSPRSLTTYVDSLARAREEFADWEGTLAFVGHTHLPGVYSTLEGPVGDWIKHHPLGGARTEAVQQLTLPPRARWIVNPGSVGQPRDGDPRAAFAIFDGERGVLEVHRVAYDLERTQAQLRAAGLPEVLAARLAEGR
nr:metallophosphoesterase family protein [Deinobacterium chartae]